LIFISRVGTVEYVFRYLNNYYITDLIFTVEPNDNVNINYLFLKNNGCKNEHYIAINAAPNISWSNLQNLEIPVPSLEIQQNIINKIELLNGPLYHYQKIR